MQRADYQRVLHDLALEAGCQLLFAHKVVGIDEHQPSVRLVDGQEMKADLIVLADGRSLNGEKAFAETLTLRRDEIGSSPDYDSRGGCISIGTTTDNLPCVGTKRGDYG